jgi:hypothetical protein
MISSIADEGTNTAAKSPPDIFLDPLPSAEMLLFSRTTSGVEGPEKISGSEVVSASVAAAVLAAAVVFVTACNMGNGFYAAQTRNFSDGRENAMCINRNSNALQQLWLL